jgi:phage repressor protein C with HTH and peptisase S24 domain
MKRLRSKLTYANVISTLALFLVLAGGTAFAAKQMLPKNSVGTKQIKNNAISASKIKDGAVSGAKINLSSLGTVPSATNAAKAGTADSATRATTADSATRATTADSATRATTADSATLATTATNANALGGLPPGSYASTQLEAEHVVGKPGEPAFENGCGNIFPGDVTEVGFYKDPFGVVHMRGYVDGCTGGLILILPPGFRPRETEFFVSVTGNSTAGLVEVTDEGEVFGFGAETGLSNIEFRTDS